MLSFGGRLTGTNILNYAVRNLDNLLIGHRLGSGTLGMYNKAYELLLLPMRQLNAPMTSVAIPALSRLQDQPDRFRTYYRQALLLLTSVGMPLVTFLFVAADHVILLVLGSKWTEAAPIFRALSPAAFMATFNVAGSWIYISLGRTDRQLRWAMVSAMVIVTGFFIGIRWGVIGVALAFSISQCCLRFPGLAYCYHGSFIGFSDLFSALWRPTAAALIAGLATFLFTPFLPTCSWLIVDVTVELGCFVFVYLLCWLTMPGGRRAYAHLLQLVKMLQPPLDEIGNA